LFLSHVVHKLLAYSIFYDSHLKILVYVLKRIVKFKKYVLVNKIKVILVNGTIKEMVNLMWTHLTKQTDIQNGNIFENNLT
jgi:hypothetical protein